MKIIYKIIFIALLLLFGSFWAFKKFNFNVSHEVGETLDSLNGVKVYYNGGVSNVEERNMVDGYNIGLKYQCVEFVKRYYFEFYQHEMPNSYGNAKDFFNSAIADGKTNVDRALFQFTNPSSSKPKIGDLLVFNGTISNKYGHVAIVSAVFDTEIEIIQQNPGPYGKSRVNYNLDGKDGKWRIDNVRVLGWLRK